MQTPLKTIYLLGMVEILLLSLVGVWFYRIEHRPLAEVSETVRETLSPPPALGEKPCQRTGCSGQICSDGEVVTTCEWSAASHCYQKAECQRQADGRCGFTPTTELQTCLEKVKMPTKSPSQTKKETGPQPW